MIINSGYSTYNFNNRNAVKLTTPKQPCNQINFAGHSQIESCSKLGFNILIHQTALGRELKTKLFVRDYLLNNFSGKDPIKIVSGGCSTGEEGMTYSMLFHGNEDRVSIIGIDIGKKAIKQANSRKLIFEIPKKNVNIYEHFDSIESSPYTDYYLLEDKNNGITSEQQYFKALFKEFFEPTNRKIRTPFWEWLHNQMEKQNGINPLELDRFEYKLKDNFGKNCKFIEGDVRNIDKILGSEKVEAISFNNTLYHLTTYINEYGKRKKNKLNEDIITNLITKFKNSLNEKGIVIFGEDEGPQMLDYETVPKVMKNLGFEPLNKTTQHDANVWRKSK